MAKTKSGASEFNPIEALTILAKEKGMSPETLIEKIETALTIAIKKDYPRSENISYDIDVAKGRFNVAILKTVSEEVEDPANQISLEDARQINSRLEIGDECPIKLDTRHFGRIAAQTAKQVIKQGIKEVEREQLVEQWGGLQNEAISAEVRKVETDSLNAIVSVNGTEVMLFRSDQIPGEELHEGDVVKVFVSGVSSGDRRPTLRISRTHRDLIKRLFELEVPEIGDGTVEIKSVSREAGSRSKIAVISNNPNVDALGACIGPQRGRITRICDELCGEKIDVVKYSDDPKEFIKQSLKPANVISVDIPDEEVRACSVVVPDNQLSLAIGNKGQNAKLAARLTGYKIDIKPESGFFEGTGE
ncbi:MAG: transcription termination/antitermination protein NusA [Ruminiclostridium sp.]|nr:transcription termination/antitermination protein NusA [Ruminiclostridium sp.]